MAAVRLVPEPGIPPEVACPHCGGYVRGHQWIGPDICSILTTDEPLPVNFGPRMTIEPIDQPFQVVLSVIWPDGRPCLYGWRPEMPAGATLLRHLEVLTPDGQPLVRIPFFIHDGADPKLLHTICGVGDDDDEIIRRVEV